MEETHLKDNVTDLLLDTLGAVLGEGLLDITLGTTELLDLLGSATSESGGVEQRVKLSHNGLEERCGTNTLDEVVVLTLELDGGRGLVRQNTDLFVGILPGNALLDESHDDVLTVKVSDGLEQQQERVLT